MTNKRTKRVKFLNFFPDYDACHRHMPAFLAKTKEVVVMRVGSYKKGDCINVWSSKIAKDVKKQTQQDTLEWCEKALLTQKGNAKLSIEIRTKLGLTQKEMAKKLGVSTILLAKVEGGDRGFGKKVLIKLLTIKKKMGGGK